MELDTDNPLTAHERLALAAQLSSIDAALDALHKSGVPRWIQSAAEVHFYSERRKLQSAIEDGANPGFGRVFLKFPATVLF